MLPKIQNIGYPKNISHAAAAPLAIKPTGKDIAIIASLNTAVEMPPNSIPPAGAISNPHQPAAITDKTIDTNSPTFPIAENLG